MAPLVLSVMGYINMDLSMITTRVPDLGESLQARGYSASPGGKASNAAVAAFRSIHNKIEAETGESSFEHPYTDQDIEVRIIGAVGNDDYGSRAIKNLQVNGVNTSGVHIIEEEPTGVCFITVEDKSRDIRALFYTGATSALNKTHFPTGESLGNGVRPDLVAAQLELGRANVEHVMKVAFDAGIEFLLNAAPAQVLLMDYYQYITHLIVNELEAATLSGIHVDDVVESAWPDLAQGFLDMGVKNVVITLGAQGAYYANANNQGHVPAEKVKVVDTAGAGDTFVGVYATEYLRQKTRLQTDIANWDIRAAVARANCASAHTIGKVGAQQAIPWAHEIDGSSIQSTEAHQNADTEALNIESQE